MATKLFNTITLNTILTRATKFCIQNNINNYKFSLMGYTWKMEKDVNMYNDYMFIHKEYLVNKTTYINDVKHLNNSLLSNI